MLGLLQPNCGWCGDRLDSIKMKALKKNTNILGLRTVKVGFMLSGLNPKKIA